MSTFGYNDSKILLSALGSFWSSFYEQKDFIQKTLGGIAIDWENEYFRFCENVLSLSIKDIPVFNRERWRNITLLESQINVGTGGFAQYGGGLSYGEAEVLYGGKFSGNGASFLVPDIKEIRGFIVNRIYDPSLILVENQNYNFSNNVIHFISNPFDDDLIARRDIVNANNEVVDREISLWITEVHLDRQYLWKHYGSLFDLFEESSEGYKVLLRSLLAIHMNGPKVRYATGFLNAALGLPIIIEKQETIKHIITDGSEKTIITDLHKYVTIDDGISEDIVVGNTLPEFTPIHSFVQILDNKNTPNWWVNKRFLSIPRNLLDSGYKTDALFKSETIEIPNKVGQTWELKFSGDVTPEREIELKNIPLKVGLEGFKIGNPTTRLNYLDFAAGLIKDNLFAIEFDPTKGNAPKFNSLVDNFFVNLIPVHCAFTVITNVNITDTYDTEALTSDDVVPEQGKGIIDIAEQGSDYQDGFFGLPKIGFFKVGQLNILAHPDDVVPGPIQIGRPAMHTKPFIRFVKNSKCE